MGMFRYWHRSFFMAGFKSLKYGCAIASSADNRRAGLHTNNLCKSINRIDYDPKLDVRLCKCYIFQKLFFDVIFQYFWKKGMGLGKGAIFCFYGIYDLFKSSFNRQ